MKRIFYLSILPAFLFLVPNYSFAQKKKKRTNLEEKIAPNIDLTYWKVTIPASNDAGKPIEVEPPEIFD